MEPAAFASPPRQPRHAMGWFAKRWLQRLLGTPAAQARSPEPATRSESRPAASQGEGEAAAASGRQVHVFWPDGEREHLVADPARLDPAVVTAVTNLLTVLSISGSVTRASIRTGRVQTLTRLEGQPSS